MFPINKRLSALLMAAAICGPAQAMSNSPSPTLQQPPSQPIDAAPVSGLAYADDLKLLAYNVFMLPGAVSDYGQSERAELILQSDVIDGHDAIILNELFHNSASQVLLDGLKNQYPNQTPVMGRGYDGWDETLGSYSSTTPEDGGVAIISRWPIEEQIQFDVEE